MFLTKEVDQIIVYDIQRMRFIYFLAKFISCFYAIIFCPYLLGYRKRQGVAQCHHVHFGIKILFNAFCCFATKCLYFDPCL